MWPSQGPGHVLRSFIWWEMTVPDSESKARARVPARQLTSCGSQGWGFTAPAVRTSEPSALPAHGPRGQGSEHDQGRGSEWDQARGSVCDQGSFAGGGQ